MLKVNGLGKIAMAASVALMTVSPAVAAPAAQSADSVRVGAPVAAAEDVNGSSLLLLLLALAAIVGGVVVLAGNNSDTPTSP